MTLLLLFLSSHIWQGFWKAGKKHGKARMVYANNDPPADSRESNSNDSGGDGGISESKGEHSTKHSSGKYSGKHDVYQGEMVNDLRHGQGRFSFRNGDVYQGGWKDHKKHGRWEGVILIHLCCLVTILSHHSPGTLHYRGKFVCRDGGYTYEGEWRQGLKEGRGRLSFPSGDCYEGEWLNDQRHGKHKCL